MKAKILSFVHKFITDRCALLPSVGHVAARLDSGYRCICIRVTGIEEDVLLRVLQLHLLHRMVCWRNQHLLSLSLLLQQVHLQLCLDLDLDLSLRLKGCDLLLPRNEQCSAATAPFLRYGLCLKVELCGFFLSKSGSSSGG